MVYSSGISLRNGGTLGLSTSDVLEELGITKVTLYKWILLGKIKPRRYKIGKRFYNDFNPKEIKRVKSLIKDPPDRDKGKSLLKE